MTGFRIRGILFSVLIVLLCHHSAIAQAHRKCGLPEIRQYLSDNRPGFSDNYDQYIQTLKLQAEAYKQAHTANKTTNSNDTIPVVFHIVLNQSQIDQLGGPAGIAQRVATQMTVINNDYNALNADSSQIPNNFKPYYANAGIQFGLARKDTNGVNTPGYEIITTTLNGFTLYGGSTGSTIGFSDVKYGSSGGANTWDPSVYLNVWVINPVNSGLLGLTIPHSFTTGPNASFPTHELGVVINYGTLGLQTNAAQYFYQPFTLGRTLTHELGHFFELIHIWGDDNGLCPWNPGGADDNIADTPPQSDATLGRRTFPTYDSCSPTGNGIMYVNYMDYTDDSDMHMFSKDQATLMQTTIQPNAENYSLTQHPDVLHVGVADVLKNNTLNIVPNPANNFINILFSETPESLQFVSITNILGQTVRNVVMHSPRNTDYTINLSGLGKGIYFVQCHFTEGIITRKIVLQ